MKDITIIIDEQTSVVMMKRNRATPFRLRPHRAVAVPMETVRTNLKSEGYAHLYVFEDHTIVVGVSETAVNQETLNVVCQRAFGPATEEQHSSVSALDGLRSARRS